MTISLVVTYIPTPYYPTILGIVYLFTNPAETNNFSGITRFVCVSIKFTRWIIFNS